MRPITALVWGLVVALVSLAATPEVLLVKGAAPTVPFALRAVGGDTWNCQVGTVTVVGVLNPLKQAALSSVTADANGCVQTSAIPAPASGSTTFSQTSYVAKASVGLTYLTVTRTGTSALTVTWTAAPGVTPASGTLSWAQGDTTARFIRLTFSRPGVVNLTLPGATATLTIL